MDAYVSNYTLVCLTATGNKINPSFQSFLCRVSWNAYIAIEKEAVCCNI